MALVVIVLVGLSAGYLLIRANGLAADRAPGRIETAIARRLVVLSIPASSRALTNPRAADRGAWRDGAGHFGEHCAVCHGRDGRGSELAHTMYPPVPDLASPANQQMSDGALYSVVEHGVRWTGMPAFRGTHSPDEIWALVSFVRRTPTLTPADLEHGGDHDAHGGEHDAHAGDHHEHDGDHDAHGAAAATIAMDQVDIDAGKLAESKGSSEEVKTFGKQMVTDHTGVNKQASDLVTKLGVKPADNPTAQSLKSGGTDNVKTLSALSGSAFDKAYVAHEVAYHQQVLDAVDHTLIPNAKNAELKALLVKVRPAFVAHLEHARHLQASLK
jgi:putative membrane protein